MKHGLKFWLKQSIESICTKLERSILSNKTLKCKVVYGPVHLQRLGYVLGINNVKPKICSYDGIYCPSGRKNCCSVCTNYCLSPYELYFSVKSKLEELKKNNKKIDYIVFTGNSEPTLDPSLSKEILLLREFGYKIAVFTNSSLLWNPNIQENLMGADYVSVKIDTVNEQTWLKMNRPHSRLNYDLILAGIKGFSEKFQGTLTTETMLVKNYNDIVDEIVGLTKYLNTLISATSYFMTPNYPSAESYAISPDKETLNQLSGIIKENVANSVLLCCPETEEFFATDDFENEFLGLLALHPVGVDAVKGFIKGNGNMKLLNDMIKNQIIEEVNYNGTHFYKENISTN